MYLRFLCRTNLDSIDVGDAEFSKKAFSQKYCYDKLKLIINGKNQLNQILAKYNGKPNDIKFCLLQVMGFEAVIYCLWLEHDGVYVLRKIKEMDIPIRATPLSTDTMSLVDRISILHVR
ncbi:MAG: hypothetical protein EXX96DRAFT_530740 [Benjaminiella poitrasii]|nr:MAG: hypothetical protein EXX96DRAFT_530740 [Benjaminiella poitrasii]